MKRILQATFLVAALLASTLMQAGPNEDLFIGIDLGDVSKIKQALNAGADVMSKNDFDQTAWTWAGLKGNQTIINLLRQQKELNTKLIKAIRAGNLAELQQLLAAGVSANAVDSSYYDMPVLTRAISDGGRNTIDLVNALIKAGADVNAKDRSGRTALGYAQVHRRADIVNVLKAAGAK